MKYNLGHTNISLDLVIVLFIIGIFSCLFTIRDKSIGKILLKNIYLSLFLFFAGLILHFTTQINFSYTTYTFIIILPITITFVVISLKVKDISYIRLLYSILALLCMLTSIILPLFLEMYYHLDIKDNVQSTVNFIQIL